jgi:hypothetical protein
MVDGNQLTKEINMTDDIETVTISKSELADIMGRLKKVEAASSETGTVTQQCNVCGDIVEGKCVKHPNDVTNHVGVDRFGNPALVRQT